MKVLKQDDPIHTPKRFATLYPNIGGLIDISFDPHPPYEPEDFNDTQIEYIKLPVGVIGCICYTFCVLTQ